MNFKQYFESTQNKVLYILRGLSGSGKSTLSKNITDKEGGYIFSTDEFHYKDGKYQFDPEKKALYHQMNIKRAEDAMKAGKSPIIIDNTSIKFEYAEPYVKAAKENGYEIKVAEPNTPWAFDLEELTKRNSGRAPKDVIKQMLIDWEPHDLFMQKLNNKKAFVQDENN